jgi:hypothetical protein
VKCAAKKGERPSKTGPEGIQKRLVSGKNQKTSVVPNRVDSSVEVRSKEGRTAAVVGVAVRVRWTHKGVGGGGGGRVVTGLGVEA